MEGTGGDGTGAEARTEDRRRGGMTGGVVRVVNYVTQNSDWEILTGALAAFVSPSDRTTDNGQVLRHSPQRRQ